MMLLHKKKNSKHFCTVGLETSTPHGKAQRRSQRWEVVNAVLFEDDSYDYENDNTEQKDEESSLDDETLHRIADACSNATEECRQEAYERGLKLYKSLVSEGAFSRPSIEKSGSQRQKRRIGGLFRNARHSVRRACSVSNSPTKRFFSFEPRRTQSLSQTVGKLEL